MEDLVHRAALPEPRKLTALVASLRECLSAERIAITEQDLDSLDEVLSTKAIVLEGLAAAGAGHPAVRLRWPTLHADMRAAEIEQRLNDAAMAAWITTVAHEISGVRTAISALNRFQQQFIPASRAESRQQLLGWG